MNAINAAIEKIGRGLGKEHQLYGRGGERAVRTSKGGRIIYEEEGETIRLKDYTPAHDYKRH